MTKTTFGGKNAEQYEAMMSALFKASGGSDSQSVYDYLENTPKTSLVVELVDALNSVGYRIEKV